MGHSFKKVIVQTLLPWVITVVALYIAFRGVDFQVLIDHLNDTEPLWILVAIVCTVLSYLLRSYRWRYFFLTPQISYGEATRVLILGFFMNNILPARAGELVRAHLGAKISGQSRTLVLATIASERLIDGLTISIMFVLFSAGIGDERVADNLLYVSLAFGGATLFVLALLLFREKVFSLAERIQGKVASPASSYAIERFRIFIEGLGPLFMRSRLPIISALSILTWTVELCVYFAILNAFNAQLSLALCVLFLVAVNFSSLIPAAPGGIGVIEAIASAVLISVGVGREKALTMVICQHAIQFLVVGIPGAMVILTWKRRVRSLSALREEALGEDS